jgi:hypothetical protein
VALSVGLVTSAAAEAAFEVGETIALEVEGRGANFGLVPTESRSQRHGYN